MSKEERRERRRQKKIEWRAEVDRLYLRQGQRNQPTERDQRRDWESARRRRAIYGMLNWEREEMRDTPRTDAVDLATPAEFDPVIRYARMMAHAGQLERELTEAVALLRRVSDLGVLYERDYALCTETLTLLKSARTQTP